MVCGVSVNPPGFHRYEPAGSSDKPHFLDRFKRTAFAPHSHGITYQDVDSMWTLMYESNQRCKNHNKSL